MPYEPASPSSKPPAQQESSLAPVGPTSSVSCTPSPVSLTFALGESGTRQSGSHPASHKTDDSNSPASAIVQPLQSEDMHMPIYKRGSVQIHYEEAGSGFPLLVIPGG